MSDETKKPTEHEEILARVIEREKAAKVQEEKKAFLASELLPEKFGPAQETAKYLKEKGFIDKIFESSPELEVLAMGPYKDGVKLRDAVLRRGAELIALKEKDDEAARAKEQLSKGVPPVQSPADSPARPAAAQPPATDPQLLYPTDKEFTKKLAEAGVSKGMVDLAALAARDY